MPRHHRSSHTHIVLFEARFIFPLDHFPCPAIDKGFISLPISSTLSPQCKIFWAASGSQGVFRTVTGQDKAGQLTLASQRRGVTQLTFCCNLVWMNGHLLENVPDSVVWCLSLYFPRVFFPFRSERILGAQEAESCCNHSFLVPPYYLFSVFQNIIPLPLMVLETR